MAASAGTLIAVGKSGRTYSIDLYIPDAIATLVTFNPAGLAVIASPATWRAPEPCVITDVSTPAAPTAVGATITADGANINGGTIRWANQLAANPNRMRLNLPVAGGQFVGGLQF